MNRAASIEDLKTTIQGRRDQAIELLQGLVQIPSVTGNEGAVQDYAERLLTDRGMEVDRWESTPEEIKPYELHVGLEGGLEGRPNLAGKLAGSGGGRSILLNAHIDVVDEGDPSLWKYPPYSGHVEGDLLYGRGSCDMKGGLVSYLIALDALRDLGITLAGDVTVNTTVGEEDGGVGALSTMLRGYRADAALITEPTKLALVRAHGGSLVMRLTVYGRSAHGAFRDEGVSAVEKFIPIFQDLQVWESERNQSLDHPLYRDVENKIPISFGVVRSGEWASTVPEKLIAEGRLGLIPGEDLETFQQEVIDRINGVVSQDPWMSEHPPLIEWFGGQFAPSETAEDAPITQALVAAHQATTGEPPVIQGEPYGADMRHFILFGGMDCVMYGAGDARVAHQDNEHMSITELLTASETIARLLVDWCGVAE